MTNSSESKLIVVCVGTRPDFIKMAPVIFKLEEAGIDYRILHTGQHYSPDLAYIYKELQLRDPDFHITGVEDCKTHATKTAKIMVEAERYFLEEKPCLVLVQGDTDHSLACWLAARKLKISLGHVEAGLRSGDWRTPEEHNRRILDHISELLFTPTTRSIENLARENAPGLIIPTGNTVVDSLHMVHERVLVAARLHATSISTFVYTRSTEIRSASGMLTGFVIDPKKYVLLTLHREENVDDVNVLKDIVEGLKKIRNKLGIPIIYPAHPRTIDRLEKFNLLEEMRNYVEVLPPLPYIDFLAAVMNAQLVLTDSGGVQEEACILQVPAVILRESTDRAESLMVGAAMMGYGSEEMLEAAEMMMKSSREWSNPFGDGNAAGRIVDSLPQFIWGNYPGLKYLGPALEGAGDLPR